VKSNLLALLGKRMKTLSYLILIGILIWLLVNCIVIWESGLSPLTGEFYRLTALRMVNQLQALLNKIESFLQK
jgi:hypothetical protein